MPPISRYSATIAASIASGASLSGGVEIGNYPILALFVSSGWTSAAITFQGSVDGGVTYANVFDDSGVEVVIAANVIPTAANQIFVNASILEKLAGLQFIKIRSGTSVTPVNQASAVTVTLGAKT